MINCNSCGYKDTIRNWDRATRMLYPGYGYVTIRQAVEDGILNDCYFICPHCFEKVVLNEKDIEGEN